MPHQLLIVLLLFAVAVSGCRLKPRDDLPPPRPENEVPIGATGLHAVHITLYTGETGKPAADAVSVRLRWRDVVIASETIGRGERWPPDSSRGVRLSLSPPIRMDAPGTLRLEIAKPDAAPGRAPWIVEVEAIGRLTDGSVVQFLDRSMPTPVGGGRAPEAVWLLHAR